MEQNTKKQERRLEMVFLLAVFLTILMWAMVQPFNASPDEAMRYQIVDYIMRHGKLPVGYDAEIRDPNWGISYAFYPITTYIAGAVFGKIATLFSSSGMAPIYGARLVNVILGTITAGLNLKIGKMLFEKRMAWFYTILICFLPGTIFFNSYVNMDALGLCASSWVVLCWCKAVKNDWSVKLCVELGAAISFCALSYFNAYGYILCSILFFCTTMLLCGRKKWDVKRMIQLGLVVTAVVAVLAGWWFIRNAVLYDGDFIGRSTCAKYGEMYAAPGFTNETKILPKRMDMTIWDMYMWIPGEWQYNWLVTVLVSFIGVFGYMNVFLAKIWYKIYIAGFGIGILASIPLWKKMVRIRKQEEAVERTEETEEEEITYLVVKKEKRWSREALFHISMAVAMVIPFILLTIYAYSSDFQAQGRYILPMILPFMYLVTKGINALLKRLVKKETVRKWIVRIVEGVYIASAYAVYFLVFLPLYR